MTTIEEAASATYKAVFHNLGTHWRNDGVYYTHARRCKDRYLDDGYFCTWWQARMLGLTIDSLGGVTVCTIVRNGVAYVGMARCRADENYCKKLGRMISLARASAVLYDARKITSELRSEFTTKAPERAVAQDVPEPRGRLYTVAAVFEGRVCWNGSIVQVYAETDEEAIARSWAYQHEGCVAACDTAVILGYTEPEGRSRPVMTESEWASDEGCRR